MTTANNIIIPLIAGLALGGFFFAGLWFTVKKAVESKHTAVWVLTSAVLRTGIILIGFYFVGVDNLQRLLICVLGFIVARFVIMYLTKYYDQKQFQLNKSDPS